MTERLGQAEEEDMVKVLALSPHTDDVELGAGALLARLVDDGAEVTVVAFSTGHKESGATKEEMAAAMHVLGITVWAIRNYPDHFYYRQRQTLLRDLEKMRDALVPDLVLVPASGDPHQDHQTVTQEALRAWRWCNVRMLGYETLRVRPPSEPLRLSCYAPASEQHWTRKWAAVDAYVSQWENDCMKGDVLRGLARVRGAQVGCQYAEAFEVLRWTL